MGIWRAIKFGNKGPMHFLAKKSRMTSKIYVDQALRPLAVHFYEECLKGIEEMIYMDDGAGYHTSKNIKKFCAEVGLLRMIWPAQLPDLNSIENLWRIIKIRVSSHRHYIHSVEEMTVAISEEWEMLTEEDYRKYIESMHKRCKLVILAKGGSIKY